MNRRFAFSRSMMVSAFALSLLTACNGTTPLPLFSLDTSLKAGQTASPSAAAASSDASAAGQTTSTPSAAGQGGSQAMTASEASLSAGPQVNSGGPVAQEVPVYTVVSQGLSQTQVRQLADAYGLPNLKAEADGSVAYLDAERFQQLPVGDKPDGDFAVKATSPKLTTPMYVYPTVYPSAYPSLKPTPLPTVNPDSVPSTAPSGDPGELIDKEEGLAVQPQYLNLKAVQAIKVMPEREAVDRILIGLNKAGLMPQGQQMVGHSEFEARFDGETVKTQLDTQLGFSQQLGPYPLIGPGAKVKVVVDGDGSVTQLRYAGRQLTRGGTVAVMTAAEAEKQALEQLQADTQANWRLASELIYYAPPLSQPVRNILPYYQVKASFDGPDGTINSRMLLIPAVRNGLKLQLEMKQDGAQMRAQARVEGGTAPYRYSWSSASSAIDAQGDAISYALKPRERGNQETLYLTVTDANGLTSSVRASRTLENVAALSLSQASTFRTMMPGRYDAGVEWVGQSMGLGGSHDNAYGFVNTFVSRGVPIAFNWGDTNAWEEDFKKASSGGTDDLYVDNVDMVFYTGHANGNGWAFPGAHDDGFLDYTEASYGERELEWLMIAACGPMQLSEGSMHLFDRWGRVFKGLHLLAGYATVSYDNTIEGDRLARHLLNDNLTVRSSWAQMATEAQPSSVTYGYMGVIGPNGLSDINDHYWGHGSVGPDIHDVHGYWAIHSPS